VLGVQADQGADGLQQQSAIEGSSSAMQSMHRYCADEVAVCADVIIISSSSSSSSSSAGTSTTTATATATAAATTTTTATTAAAATATTATALACSATGRRRASYCSCASGCCSTGAAYCGDAAHGLGDGWRVAPLPGPALRN